MRKRHYYINNRHQYNEHAKELYEKWLLDKVKWNRLPSGIRNIGFEELISYLMEKEFYYNALFVTRDMDQYYIGREFRYEFNSETGAKTVMEDYTSVMEVLINFAIESSCSGYYTTRVKTIDINGKSRANDDVHWHPEAFLFEMLMNLGLDYYDNVNFNPYQVDYILDTWMRREFKPNGYGSPFPLDHFVGYTIDDVDIDDLREIDMYTMRKLYDIENEKRFLKYMMRKDFYNYFEFKKQKKSYHFVLEKAKKLTKFNRYPGCFW